MAPIAFILSFCLAALGAVGVAAPDVLLRIVQRFNNPVGLYAGAVIRLAFGVILLLATPEARTPDAVRVLGVVLVAVGLITPLLGLERLGGLLHWWSVRSPAMLRAWAAVALILGLFLAYAVAP